MKCIGLCAVGVLFASVAAAGQAPDAKVEPSEVWLSVQRNSRPVGYVHTVRTIVELDGRKVFHTLHESKTWAARQVRKNRSEAWTELDGRLIKVVYRRPKPPHDVYRTIEVKGKEIAVTFAAPGQAHARTVKIPDGTEVHAGWQAWLDRLHHLKAEFKPGTVYRFKSLDSRRTGLEEHRLKAVRRDAWHHNGKKVESFQFDWTHGPSDYPVHITTTTDYEVRRVTFSRSVSWLRVAKPDPAWLEKKKESATPGGAPPASTR